MTEVRRIHGDKGRVLGGGSGEPEKGQDVDGLV